MRDDTLHNLKEINMVKESRPNTYNRIIDASLKLFNEEGERNISTNHIASYLGISPGNLYYHFRNKDEIIMQLFKRYSEELLCYLQQVKPPQDTDAIKNYMLGVYDVLWNYRFLFSDLNAMLSRSADLLGEHNNFTRVQVSPMLQNLLQQLTDTGFILTDEVARKEMAVNIWLITKYWCDYDSTLYASKLTETSKFRGTHQTLTLLRPYVAPAYREEFNRMMADLSNQV
ncbi:Transcriptional regulator, TetR family [Snodgrassella communis]|nr:Transcriptional regulator, TetR family [Snodgrassella communis]KDN14593.1 Transcriptional regulator, TetR family [Snodgrassella communis]